MKRLLALTVLCVACNRPDAAPRAPVPAASSVASSIEEPPPAPAVKTKQEPHAFVKKDRSFTQTKLAGDPGWDVLVRGAIDPAFRASVDAAVAGWKGARPIVSADGRFFVAGRSASGAPAIVAFDASGKPGASFAGDDPFLGPSGELVFHDGNQIFALGSSGLSAIGPVQAGLCMIASCKERAVPIAIAQDHSKALVGVYRRAFVSDDTALVLDVASGTTTPLVGHTKTIAYLSGATMNDGSYCTFRTQIRRVDPDPESMGKSPPGVLLCFAPPWDRSRALLETSGGAYSSLGGVGPFVVTGDVSTLHVVDRKTDAHRAYPSPDGGGLPIPLADDRTVVVEGDGKLVVVDVVSETYATLAIAQTIVEPLPTRTTAFIATGDGTRTLVRAP